ncbi:hypothetical protein C8Q70DRAFT_600975 [Cubamyces menziesii]|nr:hypothetical protein C8Q70DRAFT_600975 [Cubamyces menziesii]
MALPNPQTQCKLYDRFPSHRLLSKYASLSLRLRMSAADRLTQSRIYSDRPSISRGSILTDDVARGERSPPFPSMQHPPLAAPRHTAMSASVTDDRMGRPGRCNAIVGQYGCDDPQRFCCAQRTASLSRSATVSWNLDASDSDSDVHRFGLVVGRRTCAHSGRRAAPPRPCLDMDMMKSLAPPMSLLRVSVWRPDASGTVGLLPHDAIDGLHERAWRAQPPQRLPGRSPSASFPL